MDNYKIKVKDEAESKSKVREYLVEDVETGKYFLTENNSNFVGAIEVPEGAEFYMEMRVGLKVGCKFFFKFDDEDLRVLSGSGWQHASYDSIQEYVDEGDQLLWSRETVKKDPALISGADALRALACGRLVQWTSKDFPNWTDLDITNINAKNFIDEERIKSSGFKYRLKPQTIKVELELPKPFEPKDGETYWHIYPSAEKGYHFVRSFEDDDVWCQFGAWRTEAEVKQVVEQLRKIRGTNS